jgi:hypothetical protein
MADTQAHHPSQLFTVRLWVETLGDDRQEYRGKVQHVVSGEARHFRDWTTLEAFLTEKLNASDPQPLQTNDSPDQDQEATHGNPTRSDRPERKHRT